jgi:response regulator of citrate/malate metabolism
MKKLLYIEDDDYCTQLMQKQTKNIFLFYTCSTFIEAKKLLKKHNFELIIVDLRIKGPDTGYAIVSYLIHVAKVSSKIVIYSALPPENKSLDYGVRYFQKATGTRELVKFLQTFKI